MKPEEDTSLLINYSGLLIKELPLPSTSWLTLRKAPL